MPGSSMDAGRTVLIEAERMLAARESFLVETTLSGNTYLRMMSRARAAGYLVVLLYIGEQMMLRSICSGCGNVCLAVGMTFPRRISFGATHAV
jgi:hypothetical protein